MANDILATYSPESVIVVISNTNFTHSISGYTDGSFLTITRNVPHATLYTGADASNARVIRAVKNFDITLTLAQYSESNDVLSQLLRLDQESRNADNIFAITIKDTSGRTVASSNSAFIGTDPDTAFGVEISDYAWVIHAVGMDMYQGGNAKFTPSTFDTINELGYTPDEYWRPTQSNV